MEMDLTSVRVGMTNSTFENVQMLTRHDARVLAERLLTHLTRTSETQDELQAVLATLKLNLEEASGTYRALARARGWKQ